MHSGLLLSYLFNLFFNDLFVLDLQKSLNQKKKFQKKKKRNIRRNLSTFNKNWIRKRRNFRRTTLTCRGIPVSGSGEWHWGSPGRTSVTSPSLSGTFQIISGNNLWANRSLSRAWFLPVRVRCSEVCSGDDHGDGDEHFPLQCKPVRTLLCPQRLTTAVLRTVEAQ